VATSGENGRQRIGFLSAAMGIVALLRRLGTAYARAYHTSVIGQRQLVSLFLGILALSTSFWVSMVLLMLVGLFGITCANAANSFLQLNTPEQLRGRV